MMMIFIVLVSPLGKRTWHPIQSGDLSTPAIRTDPRATSPGRHGRDRTKAASQAALCTLLPAATINTLLSSTPIMHNDALLPPLSYSSVSSSFFPAARAHVLRGRQAACAKSYRCESAWYSSYGFDFERIRQDEPPCSWSTFTGFIPMIVDRSPRSDTPLAAGLPIDVAQILVRTLPPPAHLQPLPDGASLVRPHHRSARDLLPDVIPTRHHVQFQLTTDSTGRHPRRARPPRAGATTGIGARAMSNATAVLSVVGVGPLPTSSVPCGRRPASHQPTAVIRATTHR